METFGGGGLSGTAPPPGREPREHARGAPAAPPARAEARPLLSPVPPHAPAAATGGRARRLRGLGHPPAPLGAPRGDRPGVAQPHGSAPQVGLASGCRPPPPRHRLYPRGTGGSRALEAHAAWDTHPTRRGKAVRPPTHRDPRTTPPTHPTPPPRPGRHQQPRTLADTRGGRRAPHPAWGSPRAPPSPPLPLFPGAHRRCRPG